MSDAETTSIPVTKTDSEPENPYLRLTLRERAAIDESSLTDTQMGQLLFADDKRVQEFKAVASSIVSGVKANVRDSTSQAARNAKLAATRLFHGIRNAVADPAPEVPVGHIWITRDEAAQLITALSGALAAADFEQGIDLGEILDDVSGNNGEPAA